jgi:hypothetical protein
VQRVRDVAATRAAGVVVLWIKGHTRRGGRVQCQKCRG